jgi:hypothetical protein
VTVGLGGVALCAGGSCLGWQWLTGWDGDPFGDVIRIDAGQLHALADEASLALPAGTELLAGYYHYWQEWMASLRLRMPGGAVNQFVRGSLLPAPSLGLRPSEVMHPDHPAAKHDSGWQPDRPLRVSGIDRDEHDGVYREAMFDLDQADPVTVYLLLGDAT